VRTLNPLNRSTRRFDMGDYVGNITPHAKTQIYRLSGGIWANVKYYCCVVFVSFCDPLILFKPRAKATLLILHGLICRASLPEYYILREG